MGFCSVVAECTLVAHSKLELINSNKSQWGKAQYLEALSRCTFPSVWWRDCLYRVARADGVEQIAARVNGYHWSVVAVRGQGVPYVIALANECVSVGEQSPSGSLGALYGWSARAPSSGLALERLCLVQCPRLQSLPSWQIISRNFIRGCGGAEHRCLYRQHLNYKTTGVAPIWLNEAQTIFISNASRKV